MATISLILRKDKVKKDGTVPIHFMIIKNRKKTKIASGIYIDPKVWDEKRSRLKPGAANSARLNSFLQNKLTELQDKVFEHETISKSLTARKLKDKVFGLPPTNFFTFSQEILDNYIACKMYGNHDKNKAVVNKLESFNKSKNLMLQDITVQFLERYERFCRTEWNNKTNTIGKDLKFIRKVFNDAIRLDLIEIQLNPFIKYKVKQEKTERTFLSEDELSLIENCYLENDKVKALHRDMFVFAAYAGGLRVSDVLQLKWKNIIGTHLFITMKKTGTQISIKIPDVAFEILNKHKPHECDVEHYVFPMLPNEMIASDLRMLDREISAATVKINNSLYALAKEIKLNKHISFHISRHTFATRALRKGISIDKVSKLLGHSAIKETQIYAKVVNEELDIAMDVFNNKPPLMRIA